MNPTLLRVTQRIVERSKETRAAYLARIEQAKSETVHRSQLACGNLAHGFAACQPGDKDALKSMLRNNIAIITSYNDMLSAHQPYEVYPNIIRNALHSVNAVGQVAGGVPAMCDGVTQGQDGMELSLLSREVIAMSAAVGLSHNMFDGALYLGVCDKIVPGLVMAALSFGHLPAIFVPSGPMASGLPNKEKVRIRQLYAEGKADRKALLEAEAASYHAPGTCTFYGTANTNQMVVEFMGMQLPGSSFIQPDAPLRKALTEAAARQVTRLTGNGNEWMPMGKMVDEKVIVNGIVALLATGGSTNHTMHLVAMARAAGILINWDVRLDAFPEQVLPRLLTCYRALLHLVARQTAAFDRPLSHLLAQCTPDALAQQAPVRQVLHRLLARVAPEAGLRDHDDIHRLALPDAGVNALLTVLNKYLAAGLTAQDLAAHSSPAALAALICQRSPEAGRHAKTLLAALAPQH